MAAEVHPVAGAQVFPQFEHPLTHWFAVPEDARFQTLEAQPELGLRLLVAQGQELLGHRFLAIAGLIAEDFDHVASVAFKLQMASDVC